MPQFITRLVPLWRWITNVFWRWVFHVTTALCPGIPTFITSPVPSVISAFDFVSSSRWMICFWPVFQSSQKNATTRGSKIKMRNGWKNVVIISQVSERRNWKSSVPSISEQVSVSWTWEGIWNISTYNTFVSNEICKFYKLFEPD